MRRASGPQRLEIALLCLRRSEPKSLASRRFGLGPPILHRNRSWFGMNWGPAQSRTAPRSCDPKVYRCTFGSCGLGPSPGLGRRPAPSGRTHPEPPRERSHPAEQVQRVATALLVDRVEPHRDAYGRLRFASRHHRRRLGSQRGLRPVMPLRLPEMDRCVLHMIFGSWPPGFGVGPVIVAVQ